MQDPATTFCDKCDGCSSFTKRLQDAEAKCVELHDAHGRLEEGLDFLSAELAKVRNAEAIALNQRVMLVVGHRQKQ